MGLAPCPADSGAVGGTGTTLAPRAGPAVAVGPSPDHGHRASSRERGGRGRLPPLPLASRVSVVACLREQDLAP